MSETWSLSRASISTVCGIYLLAAALWSKGHGCSGGVGSVVVRQAQTCDSRAFCRLQRGSAAMYNQNSSVRGGRRHYRGNTTRSEIWTKRGITSSSRLAAKTEEDERGRTGKRMLGPALRKTF